MFSIYLLFLPRGSNSGQTLNQIGKALARIKEIVREPYDLKEKDNLVKLYTYISRNCQGINNQFNLKDKEIQRTGAIESNVNQVIASRFKKKGMSWSKPGALSLLKIKEAILNNEWNFWWEKEIDREFSFYKGKSTCFKRARSGQNLGLGRCFV
jgi:hypothetical protein